MKAKSIALAIAVAFLFTCISASSFAQDKNVKHQVKPKTETMKHEVKTKTAEEMKNQPPIETKKIEQTKEKVKHLKTHKKMGEKTKPKEIK